MRAKIDSFNIKMQFTVSVFLKFIKTIQKHAASRSDVCHYLTATRVILLSERQKTKYASKREPLENQISGILFFFFK